MKNKLSIYLVKEEFTKENEYIKGNYPCDRLSDTKHLYSKMGQLRCPSWAGAFFGNDESYQEMFKTQTTSAVLSVKVTNRIFLLAFGFGRAMINPDAIVDDFGLKVTLGAIGPDDIRKVSLKAIGGNQKMSQEQMPSKSSIGDFSVDINRDLVDMISGVSIKPQISDGMISGRAMLSVTIDTDLENIEGYLSTLLSDYHSEGYKSNFGWIDNIKYIKDNTLIEKLDNLLETRINEDPSSIIAAVPEIIEWDKAKGFSFKSTRSKDIVDDISIDSIISSFNGDEITVQKLKSKMVYLQSSVDDQFSYRSWIIYKCLFAEIDYNHSHYCLNNGVWYKVNSDFVNEIENDYQNTCVCDIEFPDNHNEKEKIYNINFANSCDPYINMDCNLVIPRTGRSKVELCDTLTDKKELIHTKQGASSSLLSHLFNQGLISAELIKSDLQFCEKANEEIKKQFKEQQLTGNISDYLLHSDDKLTIIYAIIKSGNDDLPSLPLFGKIAFYNVKKQLGLMGCKVLIKHIKLA